jgi:hypothetical protein
MNSLVPYELAGQVCNMLLETSRERRWGAVGRKRDSDSTDTIPHQCTRLFFSGQTFSRVRVIAYVNVHTTGRRAKALEFRRP